MTISKCTKIVTLLSWILICLLYYNNRFNAFYVSSSNIVQSSDQKNYKDVKVFKNTYKGTEKYLINTPGCYIPNYGKTQKFTELNILGSSCGVRAIFINKISNNKIELNIDKEKIKIYSHGKTYQCCFRFAVQNNVSGKIDLTKLEFSSCTVFQNGSIIELEHEIVTISCHSKSTSIYEDAYIILKKLVTIKDPIKSNLNTWNILIFGIDTMSRARLLSSMPETAKYLREHGWLDFRGYQKVGYNTFPNVMSFMTGKNVSTIYETCSHGLDECNKFLLWTKFKQAGYTTVYGEDFLKLPDTFSKFDGFQKLPTDHYMRPFFLTGETKGGNYLCTKKLPSASHILDYAYQFSDAYKKNKFFGLFWINSYSHNLDNNPTLFDKDFPNFFEKINSNGVLDNTFIIFLSDHGIRYGSMRVPVESYYEERLPMCYVWVPNKFRDLFPKQYMNLQMNQERLVTPYDMYLTMANILKISQESQEVITSEACPLCNNLFEEVSRNRRCIDSGVDEKWCTCHDLAPIDKKTIDVIQSLKLLAEELDKKTTEVKTKNCTQCSRLKIKTLLRSHLYEDPLQNKTYYVIAFLVDPGNIGYEAIIQKYNNELSLVAYLDTISPYNVKGSCVIHPNDRAYCVCKNLCKKEPKRKKYKHVKR